MVATILPVPAAPSAAILAQLEADEAEIARLTDSEPTTSADNAVSARRFDRNAPLDLTDLGAAAKQMRAENLSIDAQAKAMGTPKLEQANPERDRS